MNCVVKQKHSFKQGFNQGFILPLLSILSAIYLFRYFALLVVSSPSTNTNVMNVCSVLLFIKSKLVVGFSDAVCHILFRYQSNIFDIGIDDDVYKSKLNIS